MRIFPPPFTGLTGAATNEQRTRIFATMKAGPHTLKMTRQHRHGDLDRIILSTAHEVLPASIAVHDMAASDGVTSLDLFNLLSEAIPEVRVRSSDYYDALWIARRGPFHIFYDKDGAMMQV